MPGRSDEARAQTEDLGCAALVLELACAALGLFEQAIAEIFGALVFGDAKVETLPAQRRNRELPRHDLARRADAHEPGAVRTRLARVAADQRTEIAAGPGPGVARAFG